MSKIVTDPIAAQRHRVLGSEMAEQHYRKYPAAKFTIAGLLELMRTEMLPVAGDHGLGSKAVDPLIRMAASGFIRQWRILRRNSADGWQDWPPSDVK